jgi:hypothetical protein
MGVPPTAAHRNILVVIGDATSGGKKWVSRISQLERLTEPERVKFV